MKKVQSATPSAFKDTGTVLIGGRSPAFRTKSATPKKVVPGTKDRATVRIGGRSPAFNIKKAPASMQDNATVRIGGRSPAFRV